jgi:hypothetical protein
MKWIFSFAPLLCVSQTGEDHETMKGDSHFGFIYLKLERTMGP